ncbi:MAG: hypothetical protein ACTSQE_15590 [Candidatus Heimdallarchaeaceae archaeon]
MVYPISVNSHGEATGCIYLYSDLHPYVWDVIHAFYWNEIDQEVIDLGVYPGYIESYGHIINNNGEIAGLLYTENNPQPFYWNEDVGITPFDPPPPSTSYRDAYVNDMNINGKVVGYISEKAFYYSLETGYLELCSGRAYGINDNGEVVGYSNDGAFIWDKTHGPKFYKKW